MNLAECLFETCARHGARVVMHDVVGGEWRRTTYADLADRMGRAAAAVQALQLPPGARVAVVSESRLEWLALLGGAAAFGVAVVTLEGALEPAELRARVEKSGARAVFASGAFESKVRAASPDATILSFDGPWLGGSVAGPGVAVQSEAAALVVWTPGTTAPSKQVILSQRALVAAAHGMPPAIMALGDVLLSILPLTHASGIATALASVVHGKTLVLIGSDDRARLTDAFARFRPHGVAAVPLFFDRVAAGVRERMAGSAPRLARLTDRLTRSRLGAGPSLAPLKRALFAKVRAALGGRLRSGLSGGEPLSEDTARFFNAVGLTVYEVYGGSETSGPIAMSAPGAYRMGSVGRPIGDLQVDVRGASDGGAGRLWVRGPTLHTREGDVGDALDTGDTGRLDADGFLYVLGRADDSVRRADGVVHMLEIERRLRPWPGVQELCVCPFEGRAVLVMVPAEGVHAGALVESAKLRCGALPPHLRPDRIVVRTDALPRSSNLKVKKFLLAPSFAGAPQFEV